MNNNGTQAKWTVTSQQEVRQPDNSGQFVNGVLVGYRTTTGVTGAVFIPYVDYKVDRVRQILLERVAEHNAIKELNG